MAQIAPLVDGKCGANVVMNNVTEFVLSSNDRQQAATARLGFPLLGQTL